MSDRQGCFKVGCLGCGALLLLPIAALVVLAVVQATGNWGDPTPERSTAEHRLPGRLPAERGEEVQSLPAREVVGETVVGGAVGTISIDLSLGEFRIVPAPAGAPLRVEADYDSNAFVLTETFNEQESGAWRYEVGFRSRGGMMGVLFRGGVEEGDNEVTLYIPRGHRFRLEGSLGLGESDVDMGGLAVEGVDLELRAGDHLIEFREATPRPVEEILVDSSFGKVQLRYLGNASPGRLEIDHGMGELRVELDGDWQRDAEIDVHLGIGGSFIEVPRDVELVVAKSSVGIGEVLDESARRDPPPPGAPRLTLRVSGSIAGLRIE